MSLKRMADPTAAEMRRFLKKRHGSEADDFDIEAAIYWFAHDWHGGQSSNLYSALSTSEYRPGRSMSSIEDESAHAALMYADLEDHYGKQRLGSLAKADRPGRPAKNPTKRTKPMKNPRRRSKDFVNFGSVSSGTLRSDELVSAFTSALEDGYAGRKVPPHVKQLLDEANAALDAHDEDEDDGGAFNDLVDELQQELESLAPPYGYFGTHEGDGADFGFWPSMESIDDAVRDGSAIRVSDTGDVPKSYTGDVFHVSDHGNVTYYTASRGRLTEVWGLV